MGTPTTARTRKHIAPRATAEEIRRAVGVTKKDSEIVRKVLTDLGYLKTTGEPESVRRGTAEPERRPVPKEKRSKQ